MQLSSGLFSLKPEVREPSCRLQQVLNHVLFPLIRNCTSAALSCATFQTFYFFFADFSFSISNARNECTTWSNSDERVQFIQTRHSIFITATAISLLCAEIIASFYESTTAMLSADQKEAAT